MKSNELLISDLVKITENLTSLTATEVATVMSDMEIKFNISMFKDDFDRLDEPIKLAYLFLVKIRNGK